MKTNNFLKILLITLIIIGISIISFFGIYVDYKNTVKNLMPDYIVGRDLKGFRLIKLEVNKDAQTIKYDSEGKIIDDTDTQTEVASTVEEKVNKDEILTSDNYDISKKVFQKRLEAMKVNDYTIRQNKEDGSIIVELPENDMTDTMVYELMYQGNFEIVDSETGEVLMTNDDIKSVKAGYGAGSTGYTSVFISFEFNKQGTEKYRNITNTYVETEVENNENETNTVDTNTEQTQENVQENTQENTQENSQEENSEQQNNTTKVKEVTIKVDGQEILTTHFDSEITNGVLQLSYGSSATLTAKDLSNRLLEASNLATLLDSGKTPIVYEASENRYVYTDITMEDINIVIYIAIAFIVVGIIYYIIKYKMLGLKASISLIGYIALLLICIRLFNVELTISGIAFIILSVILTYATILNILKINSVLDTIKKYMIILIPTYIISLCLTIANLAGGAVLFWGVTINILYNLLVTKTLLSNNK